MILLISCSSREWETVEWYDSGNTKTEHLYIEDKADSSFIIRKYYETGELMSIYEYESGEIQGMAMGMFESGIVAYMVTFDQGEYDRYELRYHPNGTLKAKFKYDKGIRLEGNYFFNNGQPTGELRFDSMGNISSGRYFYENGNMRSEGSFTGGPSQLKEGFWRYFYENGNLKESGHYQNGKKRGDWLMYDSIGNLEMTVPYN